MLEQLELFQVLNQEQQTEVNDYVVRENQSIVNRVASIKRIIDLLETGGFVEDIDFERDFQIGESTHERTFGWGADKFKAEVTVNTTNGGIRLIHKRFYNGKVETTTSSVGRDGDKLECSMITPQYRAYKPASLLVKLNEYNENQELKFNSYHKKKDMLSYTINKYTILFPNAKVQEGMGYQGRSSFATVLVSFPSDSYVEFKLGFEQDKEFVFRKWDGKVDAYKGIDLLNYFNKQS
tara:strand:+ start:2234 stop:2944 length:711 start_codon:yes stop_codon:yes gene_type:complete